MSSTMQAQGNQRAEAPRAPMRAGALIAVLLAGAFVMILNETVMGVALPAVMREFEITAAAGQWLTTAYMLVMAVLIPMTGFLLQRFSPRAIFVAALLLFSVGTAAAAIAPWFFVLVVARIAQAAGTAIIMPLLTTTILTHVPAARRGRTMGLIAIVMSVAPALGPSFSGLMITAVGWRSVFLVVLPIAVAVLIAGSVLIRGGGAGSAVRFDLGSAALSVLAFGGIVFGLGSIGEAVGGHAILPPAVPIVVGLLALAAFVWRQLALQRRDAAFLDLRPFRSRPFWVGVVLLAVAMCSMFGALILLPLYMQNVLGLSALATGLVVLPGGLLMGLAAPVVGAIFDRVGARPLVIPGVLVVSASLAMLAFLGDDSPVWYLVVATLVLDLGLAMLMTPLMTSALGSLAPELYSHGSAIVSTMQQLAGAAGTAVFVTVMSLGAASAAAEGASATAAAASGIHLAFVGAALASLVAVALAFLVPRRPSIEPAGGGERGESGESASR